MQIIRDALLGKDLLSHDLFPVLDYDLKVFGDKKVVSIHTFFLKHFTSHSLIKSLKKLFL